MCIKSPGKPRSLNFKLFDYLLQLIGYDHKKKKHPLRKKRSSPTSPF